MPNVVKLADINPKDEQPIEPLVSNGTRHLIHSVSADDIDKLQKIELLEKQIDALYVVSKRLNSREHANHSLLSQLKEKIVSLSEKQTLKSQQFSYQFETLKQEILEFSESMKQEINQLRDDFKVEQQESAIQIRQQFENLHDSQEASQQLHQEQTLAIKDELASIDNVQNEHTKQLNELQGITHKLTDISDKLTDTIAQHDQQIGSLNKNATEQQNSINELFDQTHDLNRSNEKIIQNQDVFESDIQVLNEQQQYLVTQTSQLNTDQQEIQQSISQREQLVNRRFKITNWIGAVALLTIGGLSTAFYLQQNDQFQQQQAINTNQQDDIGILNQQSSEWSIQQSQISQQINALERQLIELRQSLKNNEIDMVSFEERQGVIGIQLNQLATLVNLNNDRLKETIDNQDFYKKLQFISPDNTAVYDQSWIDAQKSNHYTIQIISSTSKNDILRFIKTNKLKGDVAFRVSRLHDITWYSVVKGKYNSKTEAMAGAKNLSAAIQSNKPWIRSFGQLKIIN